MRPGPSGGIVQAYFHSAVHEFRGDTKSGDPSPQDGDRCDHGDHQL